MLVDVTYVSNKHINQKRLALFACKARLTACLARTCEFFDMANYEAMARMAVNALTQGATIFLQCGAWRNFGEAGFPWCSRVQRLH